MVRSLEEVERDGRIVFQEIGLDSRTRQGPIGVVRLAIGAIVQLRAQPRMPRLQGV